MEVHHKGTKAEDFTTKRQRAHKETQRRPEKIEIRKGQV
jgi:hypothetical protein